MSPAPPARSAPSAPAGPGAPLTPLPGRRPHRAVTGAAALLALLLTAACSGGGGDGADDGEPAVPEAGGEALEIDQPHPYTVRVADAFYDPNAPDGARSSGARPAPAGHTYLHLLVVVEGADSAREYDAPPHGAWNVEYTGCEQYTLPDKPDSCTQGFPITQGGDYLTEEQQAAGSTRGLGRFEVLEPGESYYKSLWWTVAEDALPEDAQLCEAQTDRGRVGESTGNCIPVGDIRPSSDDS